LTADGKNEYLIIKFMKTKTIKLDFSAITNLSEMHEYLKKNLVFLTFMVQMLMP